MSAFTALNGASPKPSDTSPVLQERSMHQADGSQLQGDADLVREAWARPSSSERQAATSATHNDADASHKRKRSDSVELRREGTLQERTPDTATAPTHDTRDLFNAPQRERDSWVSQPSREERSQYDTMHPSRASSHGQNEEHMGDSFRASTHGENDEYDQASPDGDDRSVGPYGYTSESRTGDSILRHDPKKRKRNFSNRTKTGCMTCRRRKKKCDETKPECTNCVKGGFVCAGYPAQKGTPWQSKSDNKASAVPLESKDPTYVPPGAYGMPSSQQQPQPPPPPPQSQQQSSYNPQSGKREPLPHYRGQALRIDPPQGRPLTTDDDRPTASTTITSASGASPDNKMSALSAHAMGNPFPTPISANTQQPFSDRMSKEYGRVPPLHDLSRNEPETPLSGQLPQFKFSQPSRNNSPSSAQQKQHPGQNPQAAARMALSHPAFPPRRTQKEEMLSGRSYYPFDEELVLERERCASACWRFNNITIPSHGVSNTERINLFSQILNPREPVRPLHSETSPISKTGRVGDEVTVEAPFNCDYGYNITIGKLVSIGRDCHFNDVREITIGDNCVIGPSVKLYTAKAPIDPKRRQGSRGPQSGETIVIEPDCWIGGGAIILPGVKVGRESTIGAGSVVTRDVPPRTVVAGNPARVIRGVGEQ